MGHATHGPCVPKDRGAFPLNSASAVPLCFLEASLNEKETPQQKVDETKTLLRASFSAAHTSQLSPQGVLLREASVFF
jgi:hypothetical protein